MIGKFIMNKPLYLAIEGIDGSGKSTQIDLLSKYLAGKNIHHRILHFTRKSDDALGRLIKYIYYKDTNITLFLRRYEILQQVLFAVNARRNLRINTKSVENTHLLLGDRSVLTAYVFHYDLFHKLPILWRIEPSILPDKVIFLDLDPKYATARLKSRPVASNDESEIVLEKLYMRYKQLINGQIGGDFKNIEWNTIDAGRPVKDVHSDLIKWVHKYID